MKNNETYNTIPSHYRIYSMGGTLELWNTGKRIAYDIPLKDALDYIFNTCKPGDTYEIDIPRKVIE